VLYDEDAGLRAVGEPDLEVKREGRLRDFIWDLER